jgi:hypothetical protein
MSEIRKLIEWTGTRKCLAQQGIEIIPKFNFGMVLFGVSGLRGSVSDSGQLGFGRRKNESDAAARRLRGCWAGGTDHACDAALPGRWRFAAEQELAEEPQHGFRVAVRPVALSQLQGRQRSCRLRQPAVAQGCSAPT